VFWLYLRDAASNKNIHENEEIEMSNQPVIKALDTVLADSYALYLKTQNYHWNVTGPNFASLHALFQTQYEELTTAIDDIAERIRVLGAKAPGSFSAFKSLTSIADGTGEEDAATMVKNLKTDHQQVLSSLKIALKAAQDAEDEGSIALLSERIPAHEKTVWMLGASL
jgi:starvation-inducible DNA-binding protein